MTMVCQVHSQGTTAPESLYLAHRAPIEHAIRAVCRRYRLLPEDAEDFASHAGVRLMQGDCAVLRRFEGRSSISTYILAVVTHLGQDWRNARWGKWRPSADARRLGPIAVHLERLMRRDGLGFEEAVETLRTNFRVTESRAELETIASALPSRGRRRFVAVDLLADRPGIDLRPDELADWRDAAVAAADAAQLLARAIAALPAVDALLLKLRFEDGLRVVDIARALRTEAKPLYRRLDRLLRQIRAELEVHGIGATVVRDLLVRQGFGDLTDHQPGTSGRSRLFPAQLDRPSETYG